MADLDKLLSEEEPPKESLGRIDALLDEPATGAASATAAPAAPEDRGPWWTRAAKMGFGDTLVGPGQLMQNIVPDAAMNVARKAGASIAGAIPGVSQDTVEDISRPRTTEEMNQLVRSRERTYQTERKAAGREGMDWARTAGALTNPVTWLSPSSEAATLVQAISAGAKAGAFQSLLQPVATEGNFLWNKSTQAALGTAIGGTLGGALKLLEPAFKFGTDKVRQWLGPSPSDQAIEQAADQTVGNVTKTAVGKGAIDPDVYAAMRKDVADALRSGVAPDAEMMARRADASALPVPIEYSRAQLTRDPMQWAKEHRLKGLEGVGEPLTETLSRQNSALIQNLNKLGAASAPSPYAASEQIIKHIEGVDAQLKSAVDEAYSAVRNSAGQSARVSSEGFMEAAKNRLTGGKPELAGMINRGDFLPDGIRETLNDISAGRLPLTVDGIQFLDTTWSGIQREVGRKGNDRMAGAIGQLRRALNEAQIDDAVGKESMEAYKQARQLAAQRFGLIESNPAYKAIFEGTKQAEPDKFFQTFVENGTVSSLKGLKQLVGTDNTAMLQNVTVGQLKRAALNRASDEAGSFSQAAYNKIMQDPVRSPRINELFADNPKTLDQLYRVGRVSENLIKHPNQAVVNVSGSAIQGANIVRDVMKSEAGETLSSMLPNWMTGVARTVKSGGEKVKQSREVQQAIRPGVTREPLPAPKQASFGRLSDLLTRSSAAAVTSNSGRDERK